MARARGGRRAGGARVARPPAAAAGAAALLSAAVAAALSSAPLLFAVQPPRVPSGAGVPAACPAVVAGAHCSRRVASICARAAQPRWESDGWPDDAGGRRAGRGRGPSSRWDGPADDWSGDAGGRRDGRGRGPPSRWDGPADEWSGDAGGRRDGRGRGPPSRWDGPADDWSGDRRAGRGRGPSSGWDDSPADDDWSGGEDERLIQEGWAGDDGERRARRRGRAAPQRWQGLADDDGPPRARSQEGPSHVQYNKAGPAGSAGLAMRPRPAVPDEGRARRRGRRGGWWRNKGVEHSRPPVEVGDRLRGIVRRTSMPDGVMVDVGPIGMLALLEACEFVGGFPLEGPYSKGHELDVRVLSVEQHPHSGEWLVLLTELDGELSRPTIDFFENDERDVLEIGRQKGWVPGLIASVSLLGLCVVVVHPETGKQIIGLLPKRHIRKDFAPRARVGGTVSVRVVEAIVTAGEVSLTMLDEAEHAAVERRQEEKRQRKAEEKARRAQELEELDGADDDPWAAGGEELESLLLEGRPE